MNASSLDIDSALSQAEARLARAQRRGEAAADGGTPRGADADDVDAPHAGGAARQLLVRARRAEEAVATIGLERDVARLLGQLADAAAGVGGGADADLLQATETCTSLGLLLLRHPPNECHGNSAQFREALVRWYDSLRESARNTARGLFRAGLRSVAPEYPSNEKSSTLLAEALSNPNEGLGVAARCLAELQIVQDALLLQGRMGQSMAHNPEPLEGMDSDFQLSPSWRLEIVDELCQPLAERLRFHFLEERTGIMAAEGSGENKHVHFAEGATSKVDRLPEWLFRYLREAVEAHGVHAAVMLDGLQPLIDSVLESLLVRASMAVDGGDSDEERGGDVDMEAHPAIDAREVLQQLRRRCYGHAPTYFLREVARMARHALRAKSFFHHPDVVGSECRDRTIALRGIEQLFMFDSFLDEKITEGGGGSAMDPVVLPPRMVDVFLSSNEALLRWWLEEERDGIVGTLHRCAAGTLASYQDAEEEVAPASAMDETDGQKQHLYPPISELFVALLHSARCKSSAFLDERSRQVYIANVIAPLCSEFLDMIHAEAAMLRKGLLAKPSSSASGVSVLRSANLPSDDLLASNTRKWGGLITGTHIAAQAVLRSPGDGSHVLNTVGESMGNLCDAMVEDFTSAFVETIVMERAKLASYTMRAPFLLSEPPIDSPRRGQRDKDKNGGIISLSPDLNDSIHVVSIAVKACNETLLKVRDMFQTEDNGVGYEAGLSSVDQGTMLRFGSDAIREALKFAISQKLLDIAIDPQGMTPEIHLAGAQQFRHDVMAFEGLFRAAVPERDVAFKSEHGPMERVVAASHLMSLESSQIQTIREALGALVVPSSAIGSLFGRREDGMDEYADDEEPMSRLNVDDFYRDDRLMEEAANMLEAKGFGALLLDEALSILNRRH